MWAEWSTSLRCTDCSSPYKAAYVSAKHGLEGLSKVVALEGAAHGVTSNCVNPGYVRTPLVENQVAAQARAHGIPADEVIEQVMLERSALKRLIEPAEVAELVAYLCSPMASFLTGASIPLTAAGPPTDSRRPRRPRRPPRRPRAASTPRCSD